jgi:hypothetical protein
MALPDGSPLGADCGERATFANVTPGMHLDFELRAFEAGSDSARWQTFCFATAREGVTVRASCDPLVEVGE